MNPHLRGSDMALSRNIVPRRTARGKPPRQRRFALMVKNILSLWIFLVDSFFLPFFDLGTAVAIYGTPDTFTVSRYVLDDLSPVIFNSPDPALQISRFNTLFYQSPVLDDGPHRVVITCLSNDPDNWLWLDYAIYRPSDSRISPSSSSTPTTNSASNANLNTTAIVAGVLGAILILVMGVLLLLLIRRRFKQLPSHESPSMTSGEWMYRWPVSTSRDVATAVESGHVTPFTFRPSADRHPVNQMESVDPFTEQISRAYVKPRLPSQPQDPQGLRTTPMDPPLNVGQSSTGSSSGNVRQYQDANLRVHNGNSTGFPADRLSAATDSALASSAGGTSGHSSMSPGAVPPAYSYRA